MNTKQKGSVAERELIHMLWDKGWAAFRAAGSGSTKYPCPDIITGNVLRKLGIEVKISKKPYQYFKRKEIEELRGFCQTFGAESWVAIKFQGLGWFFLTLEDLNESDAGFSVSESTARNKGLLFEELIEI